MPPGGSVPPAGIKMSRPAAEHSIVGTEDKTSVRQSFGVILKGTNPIFISNSWTSKFCL